MSYKVPGFMPPIYAYKSANSTNATGNNVVFTVIFDTLVFGSSSNYNAATGVLTAPYTGKYEIKSYVSASAFAGGATNGIMLAVATSRSLPLANQGIADLGFNALDTFSGTCIMDMNAGDTAHITLQMGAGTQTVTVNGDATPNTYLQIKQVA